VLALRLEELSVKLRIRKVSTWHKLRYLAH